MSTLGRFVRAAAAVAGFGFASLPAQARADNCVVGFDDQFALSNFFNQARGQFGFWSRWDAVNNRPVRAQVPREAGSWFYRQPCGASIAYAIVEPLSNFGEDDHLHLPFTNAALRSSCPCTPPGDSWMDERNADDRVVRYSEGYGVCGSSTCPNWTAEPRSGAYPHTSRSGMIFRFDDYNYFDMLDVIIGGSRRVWALWSDGASTRTAGPLTPGYNVLNLSQVRWVQFLDYNFWVESGAASAPINIVDSLVMIPGGQLNLAYHRPATQSSTAFGGTPNRATDDSTNGAWSANSVTHTNSEAGAWWQVDLGKEYRIGRVDIFNRTDCCSDRLSNFDVEVSQTGSAWTQLYVAGPVGPSVSVDFAGAKAQYVRVKLRGTNYLSLAEVRVWAANPP